MAWHGTQITQPNAILNIATSKWTTLIWTRNAQCTSQVINIMSVSVFRLSDYSSGGEYSPPYSWSWAHKFIWITSTLVYNNTTIVFYVPELVGLDTHMLVDDPKLVKLIEVLPLTTFFNQWRRIAISPPNAPRELPDTPGTHQCGFSVNLDSAIDMSALFETDHTVNPEKTLHSLSYQVLHSRILLWDDIQKTTKITSFLWSKLIKPIIIVLFSSWYARNRMKRFPWLSKGMKRDRWFAYVGLY